MATTIFDTRETVNSAANALARQARSLDEQIATLQAQRDLIAPQLESLTNQLQQIDDQIAADGSAIVPADQQNLPPEVRAEKLRTVAITPSPVNAPADEPIDPDSDKDENKPATTADKPKK